MGSVRILKKSVQFKLFLLIQAIFSFLTIAQTQEQISHIPKINKEFLVTVHVVVKDTTNQWGEVNETNMNSAMIGANKYFEPINAKFTICDFKTILNYKFDTLDEEQSEGTELMNMYHIQNKLNIYVVQEVINTPYAICGYCAGSVKSYSQNKGIIIKKSGCFESETIAHEIGHYFGLDHTFSGPIFGTTQLTTLELVNGSNCATEGDGICDTPADPLIPTEPKSNYINDNCEFISMKKDANNEYFEPDVSNIMGYYRGCMCPRFTKGQYRAMVKFYNEGLGAW